MPYDQFGEWYDDGTDSAPEDMGYGFDMSTLYNSPYMQPQMPGTNYSNSKWNFGAQLPVGQNVYNQWLTGMKNVNQLQTNPSLLYNAQVATGEQTMDPNGMMGLDQFGMPYQGSGGGGGGGANGYNPNFVPSLLNRFKQAAPGTPGATIWTGISSNQDPTTVKLSFRDPKLGYDDNTITMLDKQVDDAYNESALMERNNLAGQNQPAQQTAMQKWMSENGLINPMDTYSGDTLPGDVDTKGLEMKAVAPNLRMAEAAGIANRANTARADDYTSQLNAAKTGQYQADAGVLKNMFASRGPQPLPVPGAVGPDTGVSRPAPNDWDVIPGGSGTSMRDAAVRKPPAQQQQGTPGQKQALMRMLTHFMGVGGNSTGQQRQLAQQQAAAQREAGRDRAYQQEAQERARNAPALQRMFAAGQLTNQGRTPARDAQRAVYRYMQQGGMPR
jgi:hypothetical protein